MSTLQSTQYLIVVLHILGHYIRVEPKAVAFKTLMLNGLVEAPLMFATLTVFPFLVVLAGTLHLINGLLRDIAVVALVVATGPCVASIFQF